ncbi:MAG TPA: 2-dehydropantoate 2-reductase [Kofleriaceae bacterium]|nr:2-dehydropantoate 2-reductase [Kofleriaceae bacterium]
MSAAGGARLRVGVFGAGSIGCYVGGKLLAAGAAEVVLVGRPSVERELAARGLALQEFGGEVVRLPPARVTFATATGALAGCDVVLCCVKSQHTDDAARDLATVLDAETVVVSLQNGVRNPDTLRARLGARPVVASIVSWNVISVDGVYRRTTSGPLLLETTPDARFRRLVTALRAGGIPVEEHDHLLPHQWTKLLVNLNNAVSALTDVPTGRLLLEPAYRRSVAAVVGEGVRVARAAGLPLARWNGVPVAWMPRLLGLPTPIVKLITRRQLKVDPAARSSMWQDLAADRPTEIEYLNGEIVRLSDKHGVPAPVNRRIVELVHAAEAAHAGSPRLSADDLWHRLTAG